MPEIGPYMFYGIVARELKGLREMFDTARKMFTQFAEQMNEEYDESFHLAIENYLNVINRVLGKLLVQYEKADSEELAKETERRVKDAD